MFAVRDERGRVEPRIIPFWKLCESDFFVYDDEVYLKLNDEKENNALNIVWSEIKTFDAEEDIEEIGLIELVLKQ